MLQYKKLLSFKIFKSFLLFFLLFTFYLPVLSLPNGLPASPAYAACNPPADYSSCSVALSGPKIAANSDPVNYQQIREEFNKADPGIANQWIPTTVIYTTGDLAPENKDKILANLQAMQQNGLFPVIRLATGIGSDGWWTPFTKQETISSAQTLNYIFGKVSFPQTPTVYFGNEPNLSSEWGGTIDIQAYAQALSNFISGAGANKNFNIYLAPFALHQGQTPQNQITEILKYLNNNGQKVDGAALTIYEANTPALLAIYDDMKRFFSGQGVSNLLISEIGPLINDRLLQNPTDMDQWKSIMSSVFKAIKANPNLFGGAKFISTSFFLDTDGDGYPNVTLLVIIDKDGNVTIIQLKAFGGGILPMLNVNQCVTTNDDLSSRPFACAICRKNLPFPINSCANTLTVKGEVYVSWKDSADSSCDGQKYAEKKWGGTVSVDPKSLDIPFVGKKGAEDEKQYLADYFEGTGFYYSPPYNFASQLDRERVVNEGGVWRKLAPQQLQDQYKKNLIYRADRSKKGQETNPIHDYLISYNGLSKRLTEFIGHFPPEEKNFKSQKEYDTAYNDWKESEWGNLWPAVPMFSREDSNGKINLSMQGPVDKFEITTPPENQIIKVPHVARLFEAASAVQNLLLPKQIQTSANNNSVILSDLSAEALAKVESEESPSDLPVIASQKLSHSEIPLSAGQSLSNSTENSALQNSKSSEALSVTKGVGDLLASSTLVSPNSALQNPNNTNSPVLLAEATQCFTMSATSGAQNNGNGTYTVSVMLHLYSPDGGGDGHINCLAGCDLHTTIWNKGTHNPYDIYPEHTGGSFVVSAGQPISRSYSLTIDQCSTGIGTASLSCNYSIDSKGALVTNCGAAPPPKPACGTVKGNVDMCQKDSITGSGDTLCSEIIKADFAATDLVKIPEKPKGCINGKLTPGECAENTNVPVSVDRKVQVSLELPYLGEIWNRLTDADTGVFNIFKPQDINEFEKTEAKSQSPINYSATGTNVTGVDPSAGDFYYPLLGGIEESKEWLTNCLLVPGGGNSPLCRKYQPEDIENQNENQNQGECIYNTPSCPILTFSLDFKNRNDTITNKTGLINQVKARFPKSIIGDKHSLTQTNLDFVINEAQKAGWSPKFVVALWLEETGASHTIATGQGLDAFGCLPRNPKTLAESLNCLFNKTRKTDNFEEFMLSYSSLADLDRKCFCLNPNFPAGIFREYNFVKNPQ